MDEAGLTRSMSKKGCSPDNSACEVVLLKAATIRWGRGKKMNMDDKGFIGYRDEISLSFKATTDSYIPLLELPMNYYYDEAHIWPSEKLYRYLMKTFLSDGSKFKKYVIPYGAASLFGG